jgi:hypothetical protein
VQYNVSEKTLPEMTILYSLFLVLLLVIGVFTPSHADLGIADTPPGTTYKAKCGAKLKPCNISFSDNLLIINKSNTVARDKVVSVVTERTCRQRSILLPMLRSCYDSQYDHDITINYIGSDNSKKSALIVFRPGYLLQGDEVRSNFMREMQVWMQDVIRPVGPSIELRHISK